VVPSVTRNDGRTTAADGMPGAPVDVLVLALHDPLLDAVRLGVAAASLSVQAQGGTGRVPSLAQTRAAARQTIREGVS
jgi:2-dehydro-3-deoxygluconokinase